MRKETFVRIHLPSFCRRQKMFKPTDDDDGGIDESNDFRVDEMVQLIKSPCETQGSNWLGIGSFAGCQQKENKTNKKQKQKQHCLATKQLFHSNFKAHIHKFLLICHKI